MNPVLGAVAAVVVTGAVIAISAREGRLAVVGLAATLVFAALLGTPLDAPLGLAASLTGGILAAYLLRNLPDPDLALRSFLALLRPGAPLAVHEYSVRDSVRSRAVWTAVCWMIIIPMGRLRTGSGELYRYLWRSVLQFDGVRALVTRLRDAGFVDVRTQTVPGWQQQVVHTFLGRRPLHDEATPVPPLLGELQTPPEGLPIDGARS